MRIISLPLIILFILSSFIHTQELTFYKETEHFAIWCSRTECDEADEVIAEAESFFAQLTQDLHHEYLHPITIKMYPDLTTFHETIGQPHADGWIGGSLQEHAFAIVNPYNVEPYHSYESIMQANKAQLVELFIADKYPHHADIPRWLHQGVALYLVDYFSETSIEQFKNNVHELPTLEQLESIDKNDNQSFVDINGFIVSYLLVKFIDEKWNRATLLALLNNYEDFENILNLLKKDVENHWKYSILFRTYGLKSGDYQLSLLTDDLLHTFTQALHELKLRDQFFDQEKAISSFDAYKKKYMESDNHIVMIIQANNAIAAWALFLLESEHNATLELLCIDPAYKEHNLNKRLITAVHQNFHSIRSIVTINKDINVKSPYFCGSM